MIGFFYFVHLIFLIFIYFKSSLHYSLKYNSTSYYSPVNFFDIQADVDLNCLIKHFFSKAIIDCLQQLISAIKYDLIPKTHYRKAQKLKLFFVHFIVHKLLKTKHYRIYSRKSTSLVSENINPSQYTIPSNNTNRMNCITDEIKCVAYEFRVS